MSSSFRQNQWRSIVPALAVSILSCFFNGLHAADGDIGLKLSDTGRHDVTVQRLEDGSYEITTTGNDPYLFTEPLPSAWNPTQQPVLAFEYFSNTGTGPLQVFLDPPVSEENSLTGGALPVSQGWSSHGFPLNPVLEKATRPVKRLRIDFGEARGRVIRLRALQLRAPNAQENELAVRRDAIRNKAEALETRLRDYLSRSWPGHITRVEAGRLSIRIEGNTGGQRGELRLVEVPTSAEVTEMKSFPRSQPIRSQANGRFVVTVERRPVEDGLTRDRLLSRWAIVHRSMGHDELLSPARFADSVESESDLPEEKPRRKKGLGGFVGGRFDSDLDDLGIAAVTINLSLHSFMRTSAGPGRTAFIRDGRTWFVEDHVITSLDRTLLETARRRIVVSAIVLIPPASSAPDKAFGKLVAHPDAEPAGIYVMPNLTSDEGVAAYAAALDFIARRYSRPDGRFGRIHHWILHNEVNAGWIWTNAGDKPPTVFMDLYHRSLRTAHLIARQYDPHARVFISLEHHWTARMNSHCYQGRELLELLSGFSRTEGDFDWALAFHPYPQNLFEPKVWLDHEATVGFDTPKITFKNLEVLDAWMAQTNALFLGRQRRVIHLTEQGLNSRDYGAKSLEEQAAGMAYTWQKLKRLDSIEVFHYHNWVDHPAEGGLRIGLRKFPDDPADPQGKKPIWFLYQALGTDKEAEASAFALPIIGLKGWSELKR
jgi:hypothetical protein